MSEVFKNGHMSYVEMLIYLDQSRLITINYNPRQHCENYVKCKFLTALKVIYIKFPQH